MSIFVLAPLYFLFMNGLAKPHHEAFSPGTDGKIDEVEYLMQMSICLILFLIFSYLHIKEIAMLAIKHHILDSSSFMLKDFIEKSFNPTLILNEKQQIVFSNKKADDMFKISEENKQGFISEAVFEKITDLHSEPSRENQSNLTENTKLHSLKELWSSNTDLNRELDQYRVSRPDQTGMLVTYIV